jgi:MFS family permease
VGAILLAAAVLASGFAGLTVRRRSSRETAAVVGASLTLFAYWLLHASVDWFWEFPALTASAFAALGLAGAVGRPAVAREAVPAGPEPRRPRRAAWVPASSGAVAPVLAAVVGVLLALSLIAPWLAEREVEGAINDWQASPSVAYERLGRAQSLNPLSPMAHLVAATIAIRVEDEARATRELEEVLRLEPRTPFAFAELAALASERGERGESQRLLRRANAYAPRDQVVADALKQVLSGESIDIRKLNASYLRKARSRVGRK